MKHLRYFLLAALVAMPLTACDEDSDPVQEIIVGTVTGTVSSGSDGLSGVAVNLVGSISQSAATGAGGTYTFTNVPAGSYGVSIDASSHPDVSFSQTSRTTTISINGETQTVDFSGSYIKTSAITGLVSAGGAPVDATVTLTGGPENVSESTGTAGGTYTFSGLRAGSYTVAISGYVGVTFATTSHDVTVNTGETKTTHFTGEAVEMAMISGAVTVDNVGTAGIKVALSGGATAETETGPGGAFSFTNLTPGDYTVTITAPDDVAFEVVAKDVTVNAGETGVVNFAGVGPVEPATVSIKSITRSSEGGIVPVDLDNVYDQIEVTLNVTRNDDVLKYVDIVFRNRTTDEQVVVATQVFAGAAEAEMASGIEETVLSIQTTQLKPGTTPTFDGEHVVWVPALHNGAWEVGADLVVERESMHIPSDKKPIVLQNEDVFLAGTAFGGDIEFFADEGDTRFALDDDDETWFAGAATVRGFQWISYSTITPEYMVVEIKRDQFGDKIEPDTMIVTGDAETGILLSFHYWEDGAMEFVEHDEIEVEWQDANEITYPDDSVGPDGTPVSFADRYIAAIGAEYYLSDPEAQVGPRRYIIDSDDVQSGHIIEPDELNFDNVGPDTDLTDYVAFDPSMGAQTDYFSQYWVKGDFDFVTESVLAEDYGVGHDIEKAFLWDWEYADTVYVDGDDCTTTEVTTPAGTPLAETLTSDDANTGGSYRICGYAEDRLGNFTYTAPSNSFGVDMTPPSLRLGGTDADYSDMVGVAPTEDDTTSTADTPISWDMDETVFGTVDMFGTGSFHYAGPFNANMAWGLEAIDDRAGLENQTAINTIPTVDMYYYYPFQQDMSYLNGDGETVVCAPSTTYSYMDGVALGDNWRETANEMDFQCGETVPAIYFYTGQVTDRAGNVTTMDMDDKLLSFNWIYDVAEGGMIAGITLGQTQYTPGAAGTFNVFGSDDLEIVSAQLGLEYPTAAGDLILWSSPETLADRWDADFVETLTPQVMTVNPIFGRMDFTLADGSLPTDFNAPLGDVDGSGETDDADALPMSAVANINEDAGYNPAEDDDATADFVAFGFNGWSATVDAPWDNLGTNLDLWQFSDSGEEFVAEHRGDSSVDEWVFDTVLLVLRDATEIHVCAANSAYMYEDNGINRFYTYEFDYPDGDDICGNPPVGAFYHAVGVKGDALLVTLQSVVVVAPEETQAP